LLTAQSDHSYSSIVAKSISLALGICLLVLCTGSGHPTLAGPQSEVGLRFDLPANGNLRVENLRGGVIVAVWKQDYVAVSTISDSGEPKTSPAVIQRTDGLLSVRISRSPAAASGRINLVLSIPDRTHAAILTQDGSVQIRGLPAALLIQTVGGEIRVEAPPGSGADVIAQSRTGNVTSSLTTAVVKSNARPQVQARVGGGGRSVKLYSQAGNIALSTSNAASDSNISSQTIVPLPQPPTDRGMIIDRPTVIPTPAQRPELVGPAWGTAGAGTPARPSTEPEDLSEGDVIRVDTQLVSVNVSVVDRGTNHGLNDLTRNDFRLFEDGVEQEIQNFESASAPFNLVLLVDLSGSTARVVDLIKSAALHFVDAARPFDRIGVITFAGGQVVVSPLTTDRVALRERINAIERPQGSTKLYDSMNFAMDEVFREAKDSRRNAIVVMSDGLDSVLPNVTGDGSKLSYEEVIRKAKEFDGVVYSIWVDTQSYEPLSVLDIQQETFDLAHDRMKGLADAGGGLFYECEELKDLAGSYDRVVADLGLVYTLSYRPTNKARDGSWRAIRVNVNRPMSVARGKRGYYAK